MASLSSLKSYLRGSPSTSHTASNASHNSSSSSLNTTSHHDDRPPEGANPNEVEELDDEPKSLLIHLASQLKPGMELSRVTLPVFVLEPRSMLERITDFLCHAHYVFGKGAEPDASERFISVLQCYLAGWSIRPKGVKKPYNPILGEIFRCRYDYPDGTTGFYVAEQVSHHPPISAFYYVSVDHKVIIRGELRPKSKFLGNSVANHMEGANRIAFLDRQDDGEYVISMPNMYARGILFGKMVFELGDESVVRNDQTDHICKLDFKSKGFFSGEYNVVTGKVKNGSHSVAEVGGKWTEVMDIKRGHDAKEVLFDANASANITAKSVSAESDQLENESRRLWSKVTSAIHIKDLDAATNAKAAIEDAQRATAAQRESSHEEFVPKYFKLVDDQYLPDFVLPTDPSQADEAIAAWIWADSPRPPKGGSATAPNSPPQKTA